MLLSSAGSFTDGPTRGSQLAKGKLRRPIVSVSLAAIKELNKRVKDKDARIAALEAQLNAMNNMFSARLAKLEEQASQSPQIVTAYAPTATRAYVEN